MVTQKTVGICTELDALLNVVAVAVADVKAGKSVGSVVADLTGPLTLAFTGLSQLKTELNDRKDLERTVALKLCDLVDAISPPVVTV